MTALSDTWFFLVTGHGLHPFPLLHVAHFCRRNLSQAIHSTVAMWIYTASGPRPCIGKGTGTETNLWQWISCLCWSSLSSYKSRDKHNSQVTITVTGWTMELTCAPFVHFKNDLGANVWNVTPRLRIETTQMYTYHPDLLCLHWWLLLLLLLLPPVSILTVLI